MGRSGHYQYYYPGDSSKNEALDYFEVRVYESYEDLISIWTEVTWQWRESTRIVVQWASYQISKIVGCACAWNAGNGFPATDFKGKPLVSNIGMHHGTRVTHVPWCMSGSLTCGGGENIPGIPGACVTSNFAYLARGPWCQATLPFGTSHSSSVGLFRASVK